ncbi:hypothetical protein [Microlunatus parietis]|uniref:Glycosyl hydrolase family 20, domain 2 n=1 Tax=Microlunatus parietis TaxID=682979 RepID=A0A7Y9I8M9_9ACTN|nr:hypothetical protein [Microlunatus parietis]NYE72021.1 hypothetical protein [Microlunatus parietis]
METRPTPVVLEVDGSVAGPPVDWAGGILADQLARSGAELITAGDDPAVRVVAADDQGPEDFAYEAGDGRLTVRAGSAVGASYALIGLADQVALDGSLDAAIGHLDGRRAVAAVPTRGIMRSFSSVDEDLPWFHDRQFWTDYLDWIARCRFSRFHLALGMQYNYGADRHGATDNYLCFAYPFLFDVDGWDVKAEGVSAEERRANLEMIKFVAAEATRRGLKFQLGLWNHAYDYGRDSEHRFPITGLTPETHADYCAAAITRLVAEVPELSGFTFRVHYEGGIHDQGHEAFWGTVFDALAATGRELEVDLHAKGVDQALLDAVDQPTLHPVLSAKYWAEHQGLPYHQTSIRRREEAKPVPPGKEMTAITEFSRRFTRYGYGDFLNEDRQADLIFRVWPGTQKVLLWGDPALAAGYGRLSTFAGARGVDVCEPLFFKGRKGSGRPGGRELYVDPELKLGLQDWTKYRYTYLLWGRLLYNPDAPADEWVGHLREAYGDAAGAVADALAPLSRILPLITVVHGVGGSNNGYWPEVYTNLPVTDGVHPGHYRDTDDPPCWGTVSPFDPTQFYVIDQYADDLAAGRLDGRHTPAEVAGWLDGMTDAAAGPLESLRSVADPSPQLRRALVDLEVQHRLGRYFAGKFRSAADYAVWRRTGNVGSLRRAVDQHRAALRAYAEILPIVDGVYTIDLRFGPERNEHGHWADRLPALEQDVISMEAELAEATGPDHITADEPAPLEHPLRPARTGLRHEPPKTYARGEHLVISVQADPGVTAVRLNYRHVNQAESFEQVDLEPANGGYQGTIPAAYTASTYPLMYFFTVDQAEQGVTVHPGFKPDLANQPYHLVTSDQFTGGPQARATT